ncbi:MAG TPA: hypothetical protein VIM57_00560, partial [Luteolibacter sp.]
PPDRLLSAIDVFAETEGRMKWSTNRRLHFELGLIKAIQVLGEVRLSDVIKTLSRGADFLGGTPAAPTPVPAPVSEAPKVSEQAPVSLEPAPEPEPELVSPPPPPKKSGGNSILSRLDSLIESAPEVSEPPPWEAPAPAQASPEPAKETPAAKEAKPAADDSFYRDPLIEQALVILEGKVVG